MAGSLKHLVFLVKFHRKSPQIANDYGDSKLLRRSISAAPQQSEICVKFSVFHSVFDVNFGEIFRCTPKPWKT